GVDDVTARDVVSAKADRPLGDLQPRWATAQQAAVATPRERQLVAARPGVEILEVEAEDVVPLDDVRIALPDEPPAFGQERRLVEAVAAQHVTKTRGVGQGDGDDAITGAGRGRKLVAVARHHLDVDRQAAKVAEVQATERRTSRREQILVDRIGKES